MKNRFLIFFFLCCSSVYSQTYTAQLEIRVKAGNETFGEGCRNYIRVYMHFNDGMKKEIIPYTDLNNASQSYYKSFSGEITFNRTTLNGGKRWITEIETITSRNWDRTLGGCGGDGSFNDVSEKHPVNPYCITESTDIAKWWIVNSTLEIFPNIALEQKKDPDIGFDDPFSLSVISSSLAFEDTYYNWQYHVEGDNDEEYIWGYPDYDPNRPELGDNDSMEPAPEKVITDTIFTPRWYDLPASTQGMKSFNIIPNTFLSNSDINKRIDFRINSCSFNYTPQVYYILRASSPRITGVKIIEPTCAGVNNGIATIYFDRQVQSGQTISYVLSNLDKNVNDSESLPEENDSVSSFQGNKEDGFYIPVEGLASNRFKFDILNTGNSLFYTDGANYVKEFTIPLPEPVIFDIVKSTDPTCYGGGNGQIFLSASGGAGGYLYQLFDPVEEMWLDWVSFSGAGTHTIEGLPAGGYKIRVKDKYDCSSREIIRDDTGEIINIKNIVKTSVLEQPTPLVVSIVSEEDPTAFGFTNGSAKLKVTGGTGSYIIEWRDDTGSIYNNKSSEVIGGTFYQTLHSIGAGTFKVIVKDKNFDGANSSEANRGCVATIGFTLEEPEKLELLIEETGNISCNSLNSNDELNLKNGVLTAHAIGGVPLEVTENEGLSYYYTWRKKDGDGSWGIVENSLGQPVNDSILSNVGQGQYSVNIRDANGIVIGNYSKNVLVERTDIQYTLKEPVPISITFAKEDVYCKGGNNGWLEAIIAGGTGNYSLVWSNGATDNRIENLKAGNYGLQVTDGNGCVTQEFVEIVEPVEPLNLEFSKFEQPTAAGLTNGYIEAVITGGTAADDFSYDFVWEDEQGNILNFKNIVVTASEEGYKIKLTNIGEGTYQLTIKDASFACTSNNTGCTVFDSFEMEEPPPLVLVLEKTGEISCNELSENGNPSADGQLTAHAVGGVPLDPTVNNGLPYYFTWKKLDENGQWEILPNQNDSIAHNLNAGQYALNIKDANGIVLGHYNENLLMKAIDSTYYMEEPPLLQLATQQQDVFCHNGNDGWAELDITGGVPPYSIAWSNGSTETHISSLSAGTYFVTVNDSKGCTAKATVEIIEPEKPLEITYSSYGRPTAIGSSDAWIEACVTGGTSFDDGTYSYSWTNERGVVLNGQTTVDVSPDSFLIRLENISSGTYFLKIKDRNYQSATTKEGCIQTNSEYSIYEPIEAHIEVDVPISCNQSNKFEDPSGDGALKAYVKGGVPFSSGFPYNYYWKRMNEYGDWEALPEQNGPIAYNLNDGFYALNVEDSRGTVIGVYQGEILVQQEDEIFDFVEPEVFEVNFSTTEVSCDSGNNGTAEALVKGGTPPYTYRWSNGSTSKKAENLIGGTYFLYVTDSRGCEVTGTVRIKQPGNLEIDVVQKIPPTCYEGTDGNIDVAVSGGVVPYHFQWNNGEQDDQIANLSAGVYTLKITDSRGCIAYKEVELKEPGAVEVNLGPDRTLCAMQELELDVTIDDPGAEYYWESDNGFKSNSPRVSLSEAGRYMATVTTSDGCVGKEEIVINTIDNNISAHFLLSSQAFIGEEVVLVNVSEPMGESVEWHVPDEVEVISKSPEALILKFDKKGTYEVTLRSIIGDCYLDYSKPIIVEEASVSMEGSTALATPFILDYFVYPNPSGGDFKVRVKLSEENDISLRLINMITAFTANVKELKDRDEYLISYDLSLPSGTYILLLETPKESKIRKLIIK